MKLYLVTCSTEIEAYVLANGKAEASGALERAIRSGDAECDAPFYTATEVTSIDRVPAVWRDAIPFGEHTEDITVEEFLKGDDK